MAITTKLFRIRFPEFCDENEYEDDRIDLFIQDTILLHIGSDEARWGSKYDIAQAYLTAHLLTLGTNTEVGDSNTKSGPISSKSAGGVSVTRAVVSKDRSEADEMYMSTAYGQQFVVIRNMCFAGVLVGNC